MHAVYYESSLLNGVIVPGLTQDSPQVCAFFPMLSSCRHCQTERNFQNLRFTHNHASQGTPLVQIFLFLLFSWHQYSILRSWRKKKRTKTFFKIKSCGVLLDTVWIWRVRVNCGLFAILYALLHFLFVAVDVRFVPAYWTTCVHTHGAYKCM